MNMTRKKPEEVGKKPPKPDSFRTELSPLNEGCSYIALPRVPLHFALLEITFLEKTKNGAKVEVRDTLSNSVTEIELEFGIDTKLTQNGSLTMRLNSVSPTGGHIDVSMDY